MFTNKTKTSRFTVYWVAKVSFKSGSLTDPFNVAIETFSQLLSLFHNESYHNKLLIICFSQWWIKLRLWETMVTKINFWKGCHLKSLTTWLHHTSDDQQFFYNYGHNYSCSHLPGDQTSYSGAVGPDHHHLPLRFYCGVLQHVKQTLGCRSRGLSVLHPNCCVYLQLYHVSF